MCLVAIVENTKRSNKPLESLKDLLITDLWQDLIELVKQPKTLKELCLQRAISHLKKNPANRDFRLNNIRTWAWKEPQFRKFRNVLLQYEHKSIELVVYNIQNRETILYSNSLYPVSSRLGDILSDVALKTGRLWKTVYIENREHVWKKAELLKRLADFDYKACDKVIVLVDQK